MNNPKPYYSMKHKIMQPGFTIVELLIVVVVIAILAAITTVTYSGVSNRAVASALQSDLKTAASKIGIYQIDNNAYPSSLLDAGLVDETDGAILRYTQGADGYCLTATSKRDSSKFFYIDQAGQSQQGACLGHGPTTVASCFIFNSGNGQITGYYDREGNIPTAPVCPKDINIPSIINGVAVTSIASYAFQNKGLTSVAIPNSVVTVDAFAFRNNQLNAIVVPNSVTSIGRAAFNNNQLPDSTAFIYKRNSNGTEDKSVLVSYAGAKRSGVAIPNSVTSVGNSAFFDIKNITSVTIPSSVTSIDNAAFAYNQLASIDIPNVIMINEQAFDNNRLTTVTIPDTVTFIGYYAFRSNLLTSITVPGAVTFISPNAFSNNQLGHVSLPSHLSSLQTNPGSSWVFHNNTPGPTFTIRP